MKTIIAGSRHFEDYELLKTKCDNIFSNIDKSKLEIVCGMANGADSLGLRYAKENNIPVKEFPADWDKNGNAAGPIRNHAMAKYADALILFWNGKSRGSDNMLKQAKAYNLKVREIIITL